MSPIIKAINGTTFPERHSDAFLQLWGHSVGFSEMWRRVVGAHRLARLYEQEHPENGRYSIMVRLRTDAVFVRRFDFELLARDFQNLNPGRE